MRRFYSEVGMPNLYYEHWLLGCIPRRLLAYRVVSFASLQLIAVFIFLIAVHSNSLSPPQATVVSLLALSYPAYAVTMDSVASLQYTFKIALFYVGCFLAMATIANHDAAGFLLFAMALVLFYVSFNANSLLVYFWGFMLFYAWLAFPTLSRQFEIYEYAKIGLLTGLPFLFWFIKERRSPRHGYYETYNRIRLSPLDAFRIGLQAFRFGIDLPILKPIRESTKYKNGVLFFFLASIAIGTLLFEYSNSQLTVPILGAFLVLGIGYGLALLAAAPFVVISQPFSEGGWNSKNFMLFHLPFALIVFGWLQATPNSFGLILIPLILLANAFYIVRIHLLYIAISVKDKALIRWMAANPQLRKASVIKIKDFHWIEYPYEHKADAFRPAYVSCMVKGIWPDSRILALLDNWDGSSGRPLTPAEIEQALEETTIRYTFAPEVQPGPQYVVSVAAGRRGLDTTLVGGQFSNQRKAVNAATALAMTKLALKYLYFRRVSSSRLGTLYDQYFSFSASELEFPSSDAPVVVGGSLGNPADSAAKE